VKYSPVILQAEAGTWWRVTRAETPAERDRVVAGYVCASGGRPVTVQTIALPRAGRGTR